MRTTTILHAIVLSALLPATALAQPGGVIAGVLGSSGAPSMDLGQVFPELQGGSQVSLPYVLSDGAGYTWDIQYDGSAGDGVSDAFDGAMTVMVDGSTPSFSGMAALAEGGRELIFPPAYAGAGLMLLRRVLVAADGGYARWVDVLYNPGSSAVTTTITHTLSLGSDDGTTVVETSSGDTLITSDDHGWVTDDLSAGSDDPAIAVICADDAGEQTPTVMHSAGSDTPTITHSVQLGPGETAAVGLVMAMRHTRDEAVQWFGSFETRELMADVDHPVLNFGGSGRGAMFRVAGLLRGDERDVVELRDGNRLEGTIQDKVWSIETPYGTHEAKVRNVAGVQFGDPGSATDTLVLMGGEVMVGTLAGEPIGLLLPAGKKLQLPRETIARVGMRRRGEAEESYQATADLASLRRGDRLAGRILGDSFRIATTYGTVEVPRKKVAALEMDADGGRLHRITLADGSTISGILMDEIVRFRHHSGQELELQQQQLLMLEVPGLLLEPAVDPSAPVMTLANGDRWSAHPDEGALPLRTSFGEIALNLGDVASIRFGDPLPGTAFVRLADGGSFAGRLTVDSVTLHLTCGVDIAVSIAFLDELRSARRSPTTPRSSTTGFPLPIELR